MTCRPILHAGPSGHVVRGFACGSRRTAPLACAYCGGRAGLLCDAQRAADVIAERVRLTGKPNP